MTDQPSPLLEAQPQSLDELFSRDPLDLSDKDLTIIVTELRRQRVVWDKAEAGGAKRAPKAAVASATSLEDLGL